jgi:carbamoyl-phosphate synthase large subunit
MRIMITGAGGPAGRALARQLAPGPHWVLGVAMDTTAAAPFDAMATVPAAADPGMLPRLRELLAEHRIDVFIPTVSDELPQVAAAAAGLREFARVEIGTADAVATAHDKYLTMLRLAGAGVPVPRFALPSAFASAEEVLAVLGSPLIAKPRVARGGRGVQLAYTPADLAWEQLGDETILQEFASGTEYAPMVHSPAQDAEPVVAVVEKTELKQGLVGNAASAQRVVQGGCDDVARVAAAAVRAMGLLGPVDLDIRRLPGGEPVVLEINARFGANSELAPEILRGVLASHAVDSEGAEPGGAEPESPDPGHADRVVRVAGTGS